MLVNGFQLAKNLDANRKGRRPGQSVKVYAYENSGDELHHSLHPPIDTDRCRNDSTSTTLAVTDCGGGFCLTGMSSLVSSIAGSSDVLLAPSSLLFL